MWKRILEKIKVLFGIECGDVNYIAGGDALPNPLDAVSERELVEKTGCGDMDARNKLIEHNLRLVVYIAKKFENTGIDIEDLISVGTIGLIKAVNSYDTGKNIKLATYAARCIENEILMHLRKAVKSRGDVSLDEPLNVDWEGNVLLLSDVLGTEADVVFHDAEEEADKNILYECTERLPEREKQIIKMRFGLFGIQKRTQKEIADIMGISQSYISRIEKKVVYKLRREISKMHNIN